MIQVFSASRFGGPIEVRSELGENATPIADMLRYDIAFYNPANLSEIVFPVFKSKHGGSTMQNITWGRWQSFSVKLEATRWLSTEEVMGWLTYRHPRTAGREDYSTLEPVTLREFIAQNGFRLASRHRL